MSASRREVFFEEKTVAGSAEIQALFLRGAGMDVRARALPRPELRSVVRSFVEICEDLGSTERTWPVAARPHQMLQFHLAEPYRVRHDNGPASLMPQTYVTGPMTHQFAWILYIGPNSCFQHSVSPDWPEPIGRDQYGVAGQRRPRGFGRSRQICTGAR